ncbi:MAG: DNA-directed DNA polymerase II small subunit [Candidatus Micrarchaeota archaeon]|nr:DNA-directed DNA polymerase II small subunit [Candidatus Micrarchaeota archaeon]
MPIEAWECELVVVKADFAQIFAKGIRPTPEAYDFLDKNEISEQAFQEILSLGGGLLTKELLEEIISRQSKIPMQATISRSPQFNPPAKEFSPRFKIVGQSDITGKSRCEGRLEDFLGHFRDRFERISRILKSRISPYPFAKSSRLKEQAETVRLIAMVTQKRVTKKGNLLLDVEDEEGAAKVVVPQDKSEAFKAASRLLLDDIVAIDGRSADELFIAEAITWAEVQFSRQQKKSEQDVAIAYLSDLHFGSKKFLEKEFAKFISWLNGAEGRQELAGKVKYIVVCGDVVDGIGIYPEQEKELAVKDIYKQYEMFDKALEDVPDYITVFVIPGNHDAVRRAEPQPAIPFDLMKSEVVRLGNPSTVEIEGLRHLLYHGTSLDSLIAALSGLSYSKPEEAMLELLRRRHLSPIYGDNLIVPEEKDYLVIDEEPDVMHMGHVHKNGWMIYRGTVILNSGTFQDRTDFQVRMGHVPSPGIVPVLECRTGKLHHISFMDAKGE